ncbi:MAG: alpha/beta hydrolase [Anaerolineae bacterium]|nr:alpha/beta hydrolase [Anaerolineae bacterium]
METIRSKDGTPIAFRRSGSGAPLVLVHGTLASHVRWLPIIPTLEQKFTVYAMDRRGRGESGDGAEYAIAREAEDVAALVESIGGEVNLLGHSYGSFPVLEAALLTPHVRSLIAYEPPPAPVPEGVMNRIQALLDAGEREEAVLTFLREVVRMPAHELESYRKLPAFPARIAAAHTIPREYYAADNYRLEPNRFAHLKVPTLLLLGGDSSSYFRRNVEAWNAALPNSRVVVLPGQQHIAIDTAPDLFLREVMTFLSEVGQG